MGMSMRHWAVSTGVEVPGQPSLSPPDTGGHPRPATLGGALSVFGLGLLLATSAAVAQTAPVRTPAIVPTPAELAPPAIAPSGPTALPDRPPPPRELGKPDEDERLDVARYIVDDDAPAELRAALPRLTAAFVGRQRGFEDLVNAAAESHASCSVTWATTWATPTCPSSHRPSAPRAAPSASRFSKGGWTAWC